MITYSFFLLSTVLSTVTLSQGEPCTLKVTEKDSDIPIQGICLEQFKSSACRPFATSFNRSKLPEGFPLGATDLSVEEPKSIDLKSQLSPYKNDLIPGMIVTWSTPATKLNRRSIQGYLVIWTTKTKLSCRLYKFNTTNEEMLLKELTFHFDIEYIRNDTDYEVRVYSIPPPENLAESRDEDFYVSMNMTSGSKVEDFNNPGHWVPSLSTKVIRDGTVEVNVGHSPDLFNLTVYEVMLLQSSVDKYNPVKTEPYLGQLYSESPGGVLYFPDLPTDEYRVVVRVLDPFWKKDGKCLCWILEGKDRHCTNTCGSIGTKWFHVKGPAPEKSTNVLPHIIWDPCWLQMFPAVRKSSLFC